MVVARHRYRSPELEHDLFRVVTPGFEPKEHAGITRLCRHGYPDPQVRWHYHEEYELHLIVETQGRAFIGDYIGDFEPGHLVLIGPHVPHNWVSLGINAKTVPLRDLALQFSHEPLVALPKFIPETRCFLALLERAKYGIEFFGMSDVAHDFFDKIHGLRGVDRLAVFLQFLGKLACWGDYRVLSAGLPLSSSDGAGALQIINVVNEITGHLDLDLSVADFSKKLGMSETQFSRAFKRATGSNFTDFINHLRINEACKLLMETDKYITNICFEVGFNNIANFNRRFLKIKGLTPKDFRVQAGRRFGGAQSIEKD